HNPKRMGVSESAPCITARISSNVPAIRSVLLDRGRFAIHPPGRASVFARNKCMYGVAVILATESMILVEPPSVYAARLRLTKPLPSIIAAIPATPRKTMTPGRLPGDDFSTELVFEVLKSSGDEPTLIT